MLLSSFPGQNSIHRSRMDQRKCQDPPYAAQCCSLQYFMQYFELQCDSKMVHHHFSLLRRLHRTHQSAARYSGRTVHAPIAALRSRVPDGHPLIEDPAPPVGTVRRPPWSVAIATCPTTISSPRSPWGPNASEGVDRVSFGVAMLTTSTLNRPIFLQWRVEETVARLTWTKLSTVN